ncbi:MAG: hypothetical protein KJ065_26860 [Anaerolineae bacterium]|nr:hypothetical protein [Anaerolineae bacterium]
MRSDLAEAVILALFLIGTLSSNLGLAVGAVGAWLVFGWLLPDEPEK